MASSTGSPNGDGGAVKNDGSVTDPSTSDQDAGTDAQAYKADCDKSTLGLSQTIDPAAPNQWEASWWEFTPSEDGYCRDNTAAPASAGPYGYELTLDFALTDDDSIDAGDPDIDFAAPGVVRLHSDPDIQIEARTDRKYWKVTKERVVIPLCLDKKYGEHELSIGSDAITRTGHRTRALCAYEGAPTG